MRSVRANSLQRRAVWRRWPGGRAFHVLLLCSVVGESSS